MTYDIIEIVHSEYNYTLRLIAQEFVVNVRLSLDVYSDHFIFHSKFIIIFSVNPTQSATDLVPVGGLEIPVISCSYQHH